MTQRSRSEPPQTVADGVTLEDLAPTPVAADAPVHGMTRAIVKRSGSSFTAGMRLLPRAGRDAMFALYAFCRVVDDIADGPWPAEERERLLAAWWREIEALYDDKPRSAIGLALAEAVETFGLPEREFLLMIEGMEMDATWGGEAPPRARLEAYVRRVAGTVGRLSIRIFGVQDLTVGDRFALNLARAFQLTNILRDVEEDAALGRLYLPADLLEAHQAPGLPALLGTPALVAVCGDLGEEAAQSFAAARADMPKLPRREIRPALMMMGVYEGYLAAMRAAGWSREVIPLSLSKRQKLQRGLYAAYWAPIR